MIRITRGPEDPELAAVRRKRLPDALAALSQGTKLRFDGYDVARASLYTAQRGKCVYCERFIGREGNPIEHFRPKGGARRGDPLAELTHTRPQTDPQHYWWLAWTHENLFLACASCNCQRNKGNWFPLMSGSTALPLPKREQLEQSETFDVTTERPMLIDPATDDPLDHIAWVPLDPNEPIERMEWRPVHKTERGRVTIKVLGLDRGIADQVGHHIRHVVHPMVREIASLDGAAARDAWNTAIQHLLVETMQFLAATHGALDHFVPARERERLDLWLPRPGQAPSEIPSAAR